MNIYLAESQQIDQTECSFKTVLDWNDHIETCRNITQTLAAV